VKYWLLAIALALLPSVASAQTVKVGFVDIQRVIADSAAGKRAKERFQAQIKKAEADIQKNGSISIASRPISKKRAPC
jgi:Skp family chaperone for outer membrane proteins